MADSRTESGAAMFEAGSIFKKSQQDYKQASKNIAEELKADMQETRRAMKRRTRTQRRDSKNVQGEVLAALKIAKNKRVAELRHDSTRKKLRKKKKCPVHTKANQEKRTDQKNRETSSCCAQVQV